MPTDEASWVSRSVALRGVVDVRTSGCGGRWVVLYRSQVWLMRSPPPAPANGGQPDQGPRQKPRLVYPLPDSTTAGWAGPLDTAQA